MRFVDHAPTFTDPGTGVIDFARIFAAAGDPRGTSTSSSATTPARPPCTTAAVGFDFLSGVRF